MKSKFSIIIPVYNVAPYLRECLDSVLAQTFADWEAICVDDGSTDGSGAILDEYAAKDSRFKVIHQENAGVSAARNVALEIVRGEWACFVDGDDKVESDWLGSIADAIASNPKLKWVRTGWTEWFGETDVGRRHCRDGILHLSAQASVPALWWRISRDGYGWMNVIRRDLIGERRFLQKMRFREDTLFVLEVATSPVDFCVLNNAGYLYRIRRAGSANARGVRFQDVFLFMQAFGRIWRSVLSPRERIDCKEPATFMLLKELRDWMWHSTNRRMSDSIKVWRLAWRLLFSGALSFRGRTLGERVRMLAYLLSGSGETLIWSKNRA